MTGDLERRLGDAIGSDVDSRGVEVTGLVSGARRGARRIRRRRAVGTAAVAALVVAAVPVAAGVFVDRQPAQQVATSPTPPPATPTSTPTPTPMPPTESPVNPDVPEGLAGSVLVPPEAMLGPADLPFTAETTNDFGPYLKNRTMVTSLCGDGAEPGDELAVGGRQISYTGDGQQSLATVVRVFTSDGAQQQLEFLRESLGACDYAGTTYAPAETSGLPGDEALIGTAASNVSDGGTAVIGVVRDGNTTTGIQTEVDGDPAAAASAARDLLARAHELLAASGLPEAHPS